MTSIDVKANQPNSFSENVNVKMKLEGFLGVVSFIDKLEKMPFGVLVEKLIWMLMFRGLVGHD